MKRFRNYKMVVAFVVAFAIFLPTIAGFVSVALAGGGSSEPNSPVPPTNPGGTSYKAPSIWNYFVLLYFKIRLGGWMYLKGISGGGNAFLYQ